MAKLLPKSVQKSCKKLAYITLPFILLWQLPDARNRGSDQAADLVTLEAPVVRSWTRLTSDVARRDELIHKISPFRLDDAVFEPGLVLVRAEETDVTVLVPVRFHVVHTVPRQVADHATLFGKKWRNFMAKFLLGILWWPNFMSVYLSKFYDGVLHGSEFYVGVLNRNFMLFKF